MLLAGLAVSACTSQTQLEETPYQRQFFLSENYQAVFVRSLSQMKECFLVMNGNINVDGQIYNELGYGEITNSVSTLTYSPYNMIRIESSGSGANVKLKSLTLVKNASLDWMEYWAKGGQRCATMGFNERPPAL